MDSGDVIRSSARQDTKKMTAAQFDTCMAAAVFFVLLITYLFTFNGLFRSSNELGLLARVESLAHGQWPALPQLRFSEYHNPVGALEPGFPALGLLLYWPAQRIDGLGNIQAVMMVNIILSALTGAVAFLAFRQLESSRRQSLGLALVLGVGSLVWPYSRTYHREPLLGFLYLLAFVGVQRFRRQGGAKWAIATMAISLLAIVVKVISLIALPFLLAPLGAHVLRRRSRLALTIVALFILLAVVIFEMVLVGRGFSPYTPAIYLRRLLSVDRLPLLAVRIYGLLLSPGKGILIYCPVLVAGLAGAIHWAIKGRWEGFSVLGVLISHLVIYPIVQGAGWGGGLEWGPRYLVPLVPLLVLPLQQALRWRWGRLCFSMLLVPSVAIQIVASTVNWGLFWQWLAHTFPGERAFYLEDGLLLDPRNLRLSPVVGQFLYWRPENFDLTWLRSDQEGHPPIFNAGILLILLAIFTVALTFFVYSLKPRPWHQARRLLLATGLAFVIGILLFLRQAYWVDANHWYIDTPALREMAQEINNAPRGKPLIVSVSNQFHYNLIMNYLKGSFVHYWLSPEQEGGFEELLKPVSQMDRVFLILDHTVEAGKGQAILRWLDEHAHRLQGRWIGKYQFFSYAPPLQEEIRWQKMSLSDEELESIPHRMEIDFDHRLRLLGYALYQPEIKPGDFLYVTLYWQAITPLDSHYIVSLQVWGPGGKRIGQFDTPPGGHSFPTIDWQVGQTVAETYAVPMEGSGKGPALGQLEVVVYCWPSVERLEARNSEGQVLGRVFLTPLKLSSPEPIERGIKHRVRFNLGNIIELVGYDLKDATVRGGENLHLTLYWRATGEIENDYTVFTHLIDEESRIWGQKDSQPLDGYYPTSLWEKGELIKDEYELVLNPKAPAGGYWLEVGMYLLSTGERLPLLDEAGQLKDSRILLERVEITEDS